MFTIGHDRGLRKNSAYMLMFNLAMSDILISTLVHTFTNIGIDQNLYFTFFHISSRKH